MRDDDSKNRQAIKFIRKNLLPGRARHIGGDAAINNRPTFFGGAIGFQPLIF